jgi:hypothetical protein
MTYWLPFPILFSLYLTLYVNDYTFFYKLIVCKKLFLFIAFSYEPFLKSSNALYEIMHTHIHTVHIQYILTLLFIYRL